MSKPKHTPGPWGVAKGASGKTYVNAMGQSIGLQIVAEINSVPENVASDARLIASAPFLLEALERISAICEEKGELSDVEEIDRLNLAIKKARGEE
jgi:hypothetical protein